MQKNVSNISSTEEMIVHIQEELISLIKENVPSSNIRFWEVEERITDDEILTKYEDIYNIYVFYSYHKSSKTPIVRVIITKNFVGLKAKWYNEVFLKLETEIEVMLKHWCKNAANIIKTYLQDKYSYYLREVRFDLLPDEEKRNFIIPNLPLINVHFSDTPRGIDRVATEYFAEAKLNDLKAAEEFYAAMHKNMN